MLKEYADYRKENNIKDTTIKYEIEQLETFLSFVTNFSGRELEPFEIKPLHVKKYLDNQKEEKKVKDNTIKRKLTTIRQYFHFLWKIGKVPNDFMPKVTYQYNIPEIIGSTNYQELLRKKNSILRNPRLLLNDKLYFLFTIKGIRLKDIEQLTTSNLTDAGNKVILTFETSKGYRVKHSFFEDDEISLLLQALERDTFREHDILVGSTNQKEPNYIRSNFGEISKRLQEALNDHFKGEEIRLSYIHYLYKVEEKSLEKIAEKLGVSISSLTMTLKLVLERYKHIDYNKATN